MTKKAFIDKYGLDEYLGQVGKIDSRSVIWLATSNLSDVQQTADFSKINVVKEFLMDWNRVLKYEELLTIN